MDVDCAIERRYVEFFFGQQNDRMENHCTNVSAVINRSFICNIRVSEIKLGINLLLSGLQPVRYFVVFLHKYHSTKCCFRYIE